MAKLHTDGAGEETIEDQVAEERKKLNARDEGWVFFRVGAERDRIQNFVMLFRVAIGKRAIKARYAGRIEPKQAARKTALVIGILAAEEIDKLGRAGLDRAAGFAIRRNDELAECAEHLIFAGGKVKRRWADDFSRRCMPVQFRGCARKNGHQLQNGSALH